ncbi:hypothetical protein IFR05_000978 [Cadophora sp. M221]|nr:hypothetical protein IFR05_000978 [Cadophora sp. M221]
MSQVPTMAIFNQINLTRGAILLGALSVAVAQAQIQQPNIRSLQNNSTLQSRQLFVPSISSDTSPSDITHSLTPRGDPESDLAHGPSKGHRHSSLDKNGENRVDTMGYDTTAKAEYWEGNYERWDGKQPLASSAKGPPRSARPSKGENKFEANKKMFESGNGGSNNDRAPRVPDAPSIHRLDDGSTISEAELGDLLGEQQPARVSDLKDKYENMASEPNPPVANRPAPQAQPVRPAQQANPVTPADMPKPGTVQDLKNKHENPSSSNSNPNPPPNPRPAANPRPASNPSPALDPVPEDPSIAEQLRQFSSFDASGKPITPPISPKSGSPAPPKKGLHEKINTWEKLSDKDAKKLPEAKYELEDQALHPRPPPAAIPQDAGLDIDAAVKKGMDAVRSRNPEIKTLDNEINNLIKDMAHNAAHVKLADEQIAQIRATQAKRDAAEKEMLQKQKDLEVKRKHLADERAKLEKDKSPRQQDLAQEAMNGLLEAFRTFNEGLNRMFSTIDELQQWRKSSEALLEATKNNALDGKMLDKAILDNRARRAAERAVTQSKLKGKGKGTPDVPPIIQSAEVENGQIASLKTNVPPPNMPLPVPLPGSLITADNPMRVALDDIRIKGRLTQETADKLVSSGWGITPAAEQVLKSNNLPVDNMAKAKGAIAGFAATAHLAPVGVLAAAPEALELAALAASPEILGAAGIAMAAPEIAKVVSGALPLINGAVRTVGTVSEQALQQGIVAAQVIGVAGKESFTLITTGTTAVAKSSQALMAAGAGALGAGLGLIGGFIGGLFAKKHGKDDAKKTVQTVHTTVEKVHSKTVIEQITETLQGKTVTVEKTMAPKTSKTESFKSEASTTKSENSTKSSHSKITSSSVSKTTTSSSYKSRNTMKTTATPSKPVSPHPKETDKGPIVLPPVIAPIKGSYKTTTMHFSNSTTSHSIQKTSSMSTSTRSIPLTTHHAPSTLATMRAPVSSARPIVPSYPRLNGTQTIGGGQNNTVPAVLPPTKVNTSSSKTSSSSTGSITPPYPFKNATKSEGNLSNSTLPAILYPARVNTSSPRKPFNNSTGTVAPYPFTNTTKLDESSSNGTIPATKVNGASTSKTITFAGSTGTHARYPFTNGTKSGGNLSNITLPAILPPAKANNTDPSKSLGSSVTPPYPFTNTTKADGNVGNNTTRLMALPPYPETNSTARIVNITVPTPASEGTTSFKGWNISTSAAPMNLSESWSATSTPILVLTPTQVANITSGRLRWQNVTYSPTQTGLVTSMLVTPVATNHSSIAPLWRNATSSPVTVTLPTGQSSASTLPVLPTLTLSTSSTIPQFQNTTSTSFALPNPTLAPIRTQPWSNTTQSLIPTTFKTLVKPPPSMALTWLNTTSTAFPAVPTTLTSTPASVLASETAILGLKDEERTGLNRGLNLMAGFNSTVSRVWRYARSS